jgi:hypothetical protein
MTTKPNWDAVNQSIYEHFDRIIDLFSLELTPDNQGWVGCCPVHSGDCTSAFRVFPTASWFCFTRGCADGQTSMLHLLKLLLEKRFNEQYNFSHVVQWYLENVLDGKNVLDIPTPTKKAQQKHVQKVFFENVEQWKEFATCPSEYYAKIGFSEDIIVKQNIGEVHNKSNRCYNRVVVPCFNRQGQVIGYSGRSMYPKCPICELYHSPLAPCPTEKLNLYKKWLHAYGFKTGSSLYNDWTINETREIIAVESIGNCLRLLEAGQWNTVGLFGNRLSQGQAEILERTGVKRIIWVADRDNKTGAGYAGAIKSQSKYKQFKFRIILPPSTYNDVADMNVEKLKLFLYMNNIR